MNNIVDTTIYALASTLHPEGYAFTSYTGDHSWMNLTGYVKVTTAQIAVDLDPTAIRNALLDGIDDKKRKIQADAQLALNSLEDERAALLSLTFQEEKEV